MTKKLRTYHNDTENKEYIIIKNLWYSARDIVDGEPVKNSNQVDILSNPFTEYSHNIRALKTSPSDGFENIDGTTYNISYEGIRIPNNNNLTTVNTAVFKESFVINTPTGSISGISVYNDSDLASGEITSIDNTQWIINGGTGEFKDANFAVMTYDNDGTRFGFRFSRRIRIMQVVDKKEEENLIEEVKEENLIEEVKQETLLEETENN